jgi:hypothetical protein
MPISKIFATLAVLALLAGYGGKAGDEAGAQDIKAESIEQPGTPKSVPQFSEKVLCPYRKDASGGFSPYWAAYIIDPVKGAKDKSMFVEVNGSRLGPYSNVSGMMEVSSDGKHIAFAAQKNAKWVVVVDGVEKYTHDGLLWPWCAWSPSLEGNSFIPQTRAAVLEFSRDGQSIAYPAKTADGKYAVFVNGEPGPSYPDVGSKVGFIADQVKYFAFAEKKKIVEVHGKQVLGPYDNTYETKVSADGNHYCFWAKTGDKKVLVVDGQTRELPGELTSYVIGNEGFLAYAYTSSGKCRVCTGRTDLPGEYDEVTMLTLSPDNTKAAFWARKGGKWTLVAGDKEFPGFDGYFYYESGARKYSVMWSPDSRHIAYYARSVGKEVLVLDGQKLDNKFLPPGLALINIVDGKGHTVGSQLMQGPQVAEEALVQAALLREKIKCDPFSASLLDQTLCHIEKNGGTAFMHIGEKKEGPYKAIRSVLLKSPDGKHYAYLVKTDQGDQVVIDGTARPQTYDAIYRPVFNDEAQTLDLLTVKNNKLLSVVQPLRQD